MATVIRFNRAVSVWVYSHSKPAIYGESTKTVRVPFGDLSVVLMDDCMRVVGHAIVNAAEGHREASVSARLPIGGRGAGTYVLKGLIMDVVDKYRDEADAIPKDTTVNPLWPHLKNQVYFVKEKMVSLLAPSMYMQGTTGLPELSPKASFYTVEQWETAIDFAMYMAGTRFLMDALTRNRVDVIYNKKLQNAIDAIGALAITSIAWLTPYTEEYVDVQSTVFSQRGRFVDCEDMAASAIGAFYSTQKIKDGRFSGPLYRTITKRLHECVSSLVMVSCYARPEVATRGSGVKPVGHATVAAFKKDGVPEIWEITCASLPHAVDGTYKSYTENLRAYYGCYIMDASKNKTCNRDKITTPCLIDMAHYVSIAVMQTHMKTILLIHENGSVGVSPHDFRNERYKRRVLSKHTSPFSKFNPYPDGSFVNVVPTKKLVFPSRKLSLQVLLDPRYPSTKTASVKFCE